MATLPEDFTEEASTFIRAPLFGYSAMYGLPNNFLVNGNFKTNIITFQFLLGGKWAHKFTDKFSLTLGFDAAFVIGTLNQFGFNSKIRAWFTYPNFTLGYKFSKFALSLRTEAIILLRLTEYADDVEVTRDHNQFAGIAFGVYIEQPLWKDNYFIIGIKNNYTKFYWPTWAAYARFDRTFWIPEVIVGLVL